jgi:uncharacterized integral membrane protein
MRYLNWLVRAFLFFVLFAFASNNLHMVEVHWFFGFEWRTRLVFVVLGAFAAGAAVGVLAMLPGHWSRHRRPAAPAAPLPDTGRPSVPAVPTDFGTDSRIRQGL